MSDTKEKILTTALHLFGREGYEAVSVSAIAGALGMTKGALYKHYKNKRDIFDSIVARMYRLDAERSREYEVPEEKFETDPGAYENVSISGIREYTLSQFVFWAEDSFASDFRRLLTLEQYRSPEMAELYRSCLAAGPVAYMEDIFREMMKKGVLWEEDPGQLALEYYGPFCLLLSITDAEGERKRALALLEGHIDRFFRRYADAKRKGEI